MSDALITQKLVSEDVTVIQADSCRIRSSNLLEYPHSRSPILSLQLDLI